MGGGFAKTYFVDIPADAFFELDRKAITTAVEALRGQVNHFIEDFRLRVKEELLRYMRPAVGPRFNLRLTPLSESIRAFQPPIKLVRLTVMIEHDFRACVSAKITFHGTKQG